MADATSFTEIAPYYDELMSSVPYAMWVSYYLLLLSQQGKRAQRILDVACGTGTMCEMLTQEGFQMSGIDLSPGMIAAARQKALMKGLDIDYHVGDAAEFQLGQTYDAALSFFDSLNNILDPDRLQMAFDRVYEHLEPGGSFIFDLNTDYAFQAKLFDQKNLKKTAKLRYDWKGDWNPTTRLITVTMDFWWMGQAFREVHVQRAYAREEIEEMLRLAGFQEIRAYHSYTLDPPRKKSDRIHYTCRKPDAPRP